MSDDLGRVRLHRLRSGEEAVAARVIEKAKLEPEGIFDETVTPEDLHTCLADERCYLIAAFEGDAPVAMALAYELPRVDGPRPMMFLYEIGVIASHRRRGIGKALIEELKRCCVARGCTKMFVPTSASNAAALALYRSAGGEGGPHPDAAGFTWYWE